MKKFVLAFTILLSSFFIFNFKVKAEELSFTFSFDLFPEDFLLKKQSVDNFIKEDSSLGENYIIVREDYCSSSVTTRYFVYFVEPNNSLVLYNNSHLYLSLNNSIRKVIKNDYSLGSNVSFSSSFSLFSLENKYISYILYSTFDIFTRNDNYVVNLTSSDYTKTFNLNGIDIFPTLYDMYSENFGSIEPLDPHLEEKEKLESFYTLCIDKLKYLSEIFLSNYIYLSIIVIFIIIFVFKLIFRRFL